MGKPRAELITEVAELAGIEDSWRELAVARSNAFVTPEWFHAWWKNQGEGRCTPLVSVVRREDGEVAGVVPLVLDTSSRPRAIRFAGASLGDRFHPAAAREDEAEVATATVKALEASGYGHRMLLLERTDSEASWWRAPQEADPRRWTLVEQQQTDVAYIDLRDLDWDGYLTTRSKRFRKQVRRAERSLLDEHGMVLRQADPATVTADFTELFRLHDLRRGNLGSSLNPAARRSLHCFAVAASRRGWLRLNVLEVEGRQIAAFLGWRVGDVFDSYQGGFDPCWSKLSVGFALEAMTIRGAIGEGAREYDFLLGTEDWKQRFADLSRPSQTAVLIGARRPIRVLISAEARARRVGAGLSKHPGVGRLVQTMHRVIPTARRA
jgi:CelD/BcsL family acetyltransferase involved in cellulose biosynthesis